MRKNPVELFGGLEMGKRGAKPKSAVLKLLEGNPGRRPIVEPIKPTGAAKMPAHLSPEAKRTWKRITSSMPSEHYTLADSETLAAYCEAYAQHREATLRLQAGDIEAWEFEKGREFPARKTQQANSRLLISLASRLNLSPGDRACSGTPSEVSKWQGLIG